MSALIYGAPLISKTRAIEYLRLMLARDLPKITSYHAQCEHKRWHAEGPFFVNLLEAVGDHAPNAGTNLAKRMRLTLRIRGRLPAPAAAPSCCSATKRSVTTRTNTNGGATSTTRSTGSRSSC